MLKKSRFSRSAHHGDSRRPNNLEAAARVLEVYKEKINMLEIDFVSARNEIVSSHDYELDNVLCGSPLHLWINLVVVKYRKTLWLDIKAGTDVLTIFCGASVFNYALLFDQLENISLILQRRDHIELAEYIWISTQDVSLQRALVAGGGRWHIVVDAPSVSSYVMNAVLPSSYVNRHAQHEMMERAYDASILCLDKKFFLDILEMRYFLLYLPASVTTVLLYSFARCEEEELARVLVDLPVRLVIQYDYTVDI